MSPVARIVAVLLLAAVLAPAGAQAAGGDPLAKGRHEMTLASQGVSDALKAFKAGDRDVKYRRYVRHSRSQSRRLAQLYTPSQSISQIRQRLPPSSSG
jgi:hypothetical protein